jgi:hypothetical protein
MCYKRQGVETVEIMSNEYMNRQKYSKKKIKEDETMNTKPEDSKKDNEIKEKGKINIDKFL